MLPWRLLHAVYYTSVPYRLPSLSFPFISLPSIYVSSPVRTAPSLPALSANSRSLSSLYGDFLSSTPSLTVCLALSLVVSVGRRDHSAAFPASLLSGGNDNNGGDKGWRNGGVERGKRPPVTALSSSRTLQRVWRGMLSSTLCCFVPSPPMQESPWVDDWVLK